jgi:hypothetical protein
MQIQSLLAIVLLIFVTGASAAPVVGIWDPAAGQQPVVDDLFDVAQGAVVVSASATFAGFGPANVLGARGANDQFDTIFQDGAAAETSSHITFSLPSITRLGGFRFYTFDDSFTPGNANRGINSFRLYGSVDGLNFDPIAEAQITTHPYVPALVPTGTGVLISDSFAAIDVRFLRLEVTRFNTTGPRLVELDGLAPVPVPPAIWTLAAGIFSLGFCRRRRTSPSLLRPMRRGMAATKTTGVTVSEL